MKSLSLAVPNCQSGCIYNLAQSCLIGLNLPHWFTPRGLRGLEGPVFGIIAVTVFLVGGTPCQAPPVALPGPSPWLLAHSHLADGILLAVVPR